MQYPVQNNAPRVDTKHYNNIQQPCNNILTCIFQNTVNMNN